MTPLSLTAAIVADAEASFDSAVPKLPAQLEALVMGRRGTLPDAVAVGVCVRGGGSDAGWGEETGLTGSKRHRRNQ